MIFLLHGGHDDARAWVDKYGLIPVLHQLYQLNILNQFYAFPGGHSLWGADYAWNYFHKHSVDSLSYVGQQFQKTAQLLKK